MLRVKKGTSENTRMNARNVEGQESPKERCRQELGDILGDNFMQTKVEQCSRIEWSTLSLKRRQVVNIYLLNCTNWSSLEVNIMVGMETR